MLTAQCRAKPPSPARQCVSHRWTVIVLPSTTACAPQSTIPPRTPQREHAAGGEPSACARRRRVHASVQARLPFPRTSFPPGRPCPTIRSQRECGNHRISVHHALFCPHTTASSVREGHSEGAVRDGGRLTVLSVSCRSPLSFSSSFTALSLSASPRKLALAYRASRHVLPQPASPTTTRLTLLFCARE